MSSSLRDESAVRNIGIVAHINAGKTTLSERMLFAAGRVRTMGEVEAGTATMDWLAEEQRRGISIQAAVTRITWRGHVIHLLDTPGHVDFTAEVERCLRVLDGVVVVLDGVKGVESQTRVVWRQADAWRIPRLVFVNKMDRSAADFAAALAALRDELGVKAVPVLWPLREGGRLCGGYDAVLDRAEPWAGGALPGLDPSALRAPLLEACADADAAVFAAFVDGQAIEPPALRAALRRAVLGGGVVPVLGGSALRNLGVGSLLDSICAYLPSPLDVPPVHGAGDSAAVRPAARDAPFAALVFKRHCDDEGLLHVIRVYSGCLRPNDLFGRSAVPGTWKVVRLWVLHADQRASLELALPGDVVALECAASLHTGETLFAPEQPITLEPARFPRPVLTVRLEPLTEADAPAVVAAARELAADDPTLALEEDPDSAGLLVLGMGELHLDVFQSRLRERAGDRARFGRPAVACRETVLRAARGSAECRRQGEGSPNSIVEVEIEPAEGSGARAESRASATARAAPLLVELEGRLRSGLSHPYPATDIVLRLIEVSGTAGGHEGAVLDLEALAVACRRALAQAQPVVLEPWMAFEIECPADTLSGVLADLRARQASIQGIDRHGESARVHGRVPLEPMLGFLTRLRSATRGLGSLSLVPCGFERRAEPREKDQADLDQAMGPR